MRNLKNKQKGFTLIELLVVVVVIGALTGILISVIDVNSLQAKARDAERASDLKQIQTALELYFSEKRGYPVTSWVLVDGTIDTMSIALTGGGYINKVPTDPKGGAGSSPCTDTTNQRYNYISDGTYYVLTAIMELDTSNVDSPCQTLNNWPANNLCGGGYSTQDYCFGVENP